MYWWWPRSWCSAIIYTIKCISLIHGLENRSFWMELVFAACCFVFPVWALSLQSYEGDHEDDFDFLWEPWLFTANQICMNLQMNGLLHGGILVLKGGTLGFTSIPRSVSLRQLLSWKVWCNSCDVWGSRPVKTPSSKSIRTTSPVQVIFKALHSPIRVRGSPLNATPPSCPAPLQAAGGSSSPALAQGRLADLVLQDRVQAIPWSTQQGKGHLSIECHCR